MATAQERARARLEALIGKVAQGDRSAFSKLYDQTSAKLFGVCLRVLMDRDAAEDVLQEVYVKVWHGALQYRVGVASPMTWLITIARNAAIDRVRRRRAEDIPLDAVPEVEDAPELGPEALVVAAGERRRLVECLAELEGARAAAVRGAYLDGDTYLVLAQRHGVPLNTMRTWLRRSLMKLRECLGR